MGKPTTDYPGALDIFHTPTEQAPYAGVNDSAHIDDHAQMAAAVLALETKSGVASVVAKTDDYTAVLTDAGQVVTMNKGSGNTFTLPLNATVAYPIGTSIRVMQLGAGQTTIAITATGTLRNAAATNKLIAQYAMVTLTKIAADTWVATPISAFATS